MLMGLLSEEGIEANLNKLKVEWGVLAGANLTRVFKFKNFRSALAFANKVGELAEQMEHHPKLILEWGKVEVEITTHGQGGLTEKDFELAAKIDKL